MANKITTQAVMKYPKAASFISEPPGEGERERVREREKELTLECHCCPQPLYHLSDLLEIAQIMEKAAKVPARPCPLMMGVVYLVGSWPAMPNRLPCRIAPKAEEVVKKNSHNYDQSPVI
jgi:hypothetical protein